MFKLSIAGLGIVGSIGFGIWLGGYVMLYGGIVQAVNGWGVDNGDVVAGILKAIFFEAGLLPGFLLALVVLAIASVDDLR